MTKKEIAALAVSELEKLYPDAVCTLDYEKPYELLFATRLAAQCTDKRVNLVTPALFAAYSTPQQMALATPDDIFEYIHSVSYPNNKSRHLVGMAQMLCERYDGEVPADIDQLMQLPGVGRKTANVIASVVFNQPKMAVDTHVFRVAERIGLTTNSKTPRQTELTLTKHIPQEKIPTAHHWLILHGRYVCQARKPKCQQCGLQNYCRYFLKQAKKQQNSVPNLQI